MCDVVDNTVVVCLFVWFVSLVVVVALQSFVVGVYIVVVVGVVSVVVCDNVFVLFFGLCFSCCLYVCCWVVVIVDCAGVLFVDVLIVCLLLSLCFPVDDFVVDVVCVLFVYVPSYVEVLVFDTDVDITVVCDAMFHVGCCCYCWNHSLC